MPRVSATVLGQFAAVLPPLPAEPAAPDSAQAALVQMLQEAQGREASALVQRNTAIAQVGAGAFSVIGLSQMLIRWRLSPSVREQRWFTDSDLTTVFLSAGVLSAFLHCRSPDSIQGSAPRRNTFIVGAMAGTAVFYIGAVLALQTHIGAHI